MKIAFKHILPNISSVIIIQMMFSIPSAISSKPFKFYRFRSYASVSFIRNDVERRVQDIPVSALSVMDSGSNFIGYHDWL